MEIYFELMTRVYPYCACCIRAPPTHIFGNDGIRLLSSGDTCNFCTELLRGSVVVILGAVTALYRALFQRNSVVFLERYTHYNIRR